jgi:hypothetical protein
MRVLDDILRGVHLARRHARSAENVEHLLHGLRERPCFDRPIEFPGSRDASRVVGEVRGMAEIVASDRLHQALEDAIAVSRDKYEAIRASISIRRRDARQRTPGGFTHRAERAVLRNEAFHHVEHGYVQRDIDH